jgi:hypothetical protein
VAQVIDANGLPLEDIPLFFTADGGLLDTVNNVCTSAGNCSRSPSVACTNNGDCPTLEPAILVTNVNGVATDTLTLRIFEDPDSVTVTVKGTNLETTETVTKTVNTGPAEPIAAFTITPPGGQRSGLPFAVNASASVFDPQVDPTCYEWEITEELGGSTIIRGPNVSIIPDLVFGDLDDPNDEQDITIFLRISDEPDIVCSTNPAVLPDDDDFADNGAVDSYQIRCDFTPPQVLPVGDEERSINGDGDGTSVSVTLTATAFDPEFPILSYTWDCDNSAGDVLMGATVSCDYTNLGEKNPRDRDDHAVGESCFSNAATWMDSAAT